MNIKINGHHIDIGDALRQHVTDRLTSGVSKYFDRPVDSAVAFTREGHEFKSDASVHLSSGITLQASGRAGDIYAAFDLAAERVEKRLRRYKRRLKDHHNNNKDPLPAMAATTFVIQSDEGDKEPETLQPMIIAEDTTHIQTLSVGEAVMQMDLQDAPVVLFKNGPEGGLNMVFRRPDGNIGWVDPANVSAKKAS
jgi:ribosomal subunit interface protein